MAYSTQTIKYALSFDKVDLDLLIRAHGLNRETCYICYFWRSACICPPKIRNRSNYITLGAICRIVFLERTSGLFYVY